MQHTTLRQVAVLAIGAASWPVAAQTARIDLTHDDSDGIMLPGEITRVSAFHSRDNQGGSWTYLDHVSGDLMVSPNSGGSSGYASPYVPSLGTWTESPGSFVGASLIGYDVKFLAPFWAVGWVAPQWGSLTMELLSFNWMAPTVTQPTQFSFDWHANPLFPQIIVQSGLSLTPFPVPTTYTSTTILVLPTPAAWLAFAPVGAWAVRRRR